MSRKKSRHPKAPKMNAEVSSPASRSAWPVELLLVLLTLAVYTSVLASGGFIWDDDRYVTENPALRSVGGLIRIWTNPGATVQYYPLTFTSFWIEFRLWGLNAEGYHFVNVLLQAANSILLWRALRYLGLGPVALVTAVLFAVHPVHVESVAWITERKNMLSTFFTCCRRWPICGGSTFWSAGRACMRYR